MNSSPYFSSFQGGDYHVYPDGRILMSGLHALSDTIRGFTGDHCLIWFSNEGYLDTTGAHHRKCWGSLDFFRELPDGKFIGSGSTSTWDGQPASNIIRFHADGALDTTFQAHVWWGQAFGFLPLEDGRVYAAGLFRIDGIPDTLHLVRFMPDGSLDPSFNNLIKFRIVELSGGYGAVPSRVYTHDNGRLLVLGGFELVEGHSRLGICMLDTTGQVIEDVFVNAGCGNYNYNGFIHGSPAGMKLAPDGNYYIWGAYHGYNDGTTNDTTQRFISRLYGLDVGVGEQGGEESQLLKIYPNPAQDQVTFVIDHTLLEDGAELVVLDLHGREVYGQRLQQQKDQVVWDTRSIAQGTYTVVLRQGKDKVKSETLIIQR